MSMPALERPPRKWTEEEFYAARDAAPTGERWELVDGEVLVTPSPNLRHQDATFQLAMRLHEYVQAQRLGKVFVAPLDVRLEPGLVTQPDVLVAPFGGAESEKAIARLLLAVETLSPSSARHDRLVKRPQYQRNKVPEYWILDAESEMIERWQPHDQRPAMIADRIVWHPEGATEPFTLDLPPFFAALTPLNTHRS